MKHQPHRLPGDARHGFGGAAIDRARPLTFRLNGVAYEAFAGDTVLSALLAAGVDTAGLYHGEPIGLDERFAPVVVLAGGRGSVVSMPMDRVPVQAGLRLKTVGPVPARLLPAGLARGASALFAGRSRTLGHRLDEPRLMEGAWSQAAPARTIEADTAIVGGGIAGMNAALAAAAAGGRVVLIERRPWLGGDARFFGTVGDEESPEATIERLASRIAQTPSITVLLSADAFSLAGRRLRVHQVELKEGVPEGRIVALRAERIVLATGTAERLPVFPGNRAPGVRGAVAAFHLAERHGVWPGARAVFATPHKFGYRLALLAADAGIDVQRVVDSRLAPQSRFIDFCKASGITLASSLVVRSAEPRAKGATLSVGFAIAIDEVNSEPAPIETDALIVAGAFQPRLALWLMAGGAAHFDAGTRALVARGELEGIALAGAVCGLRTSAACLKSGEAAITQLLGKPGPAVADVEVDAIYESRDATTSIAPWRAVHRGAAFLDGGLSFTTRPPRGADAATMAPQQLRALSVGDAVAGVELGLVPPSQGGIVAQERCLGPGDVVDVGWRLPPDTAAAAATPEAPPWLHGRFGPKPQLAAILPADGRRFEAGCLIYGSTNDASPPAAIGAVIGPMPGRPEATLALLGRAALAAGAPLFVRDTSGHVSVTIVEKVKAGSAEAG